MKRREFITLLGSAAASWPLAAWAQQGERRRVGIFMDLAEQDREGQARVAAFREGMQKLGWIQGRNVAYDYRWTAGNPAVMERYAAELVALQPEVIMNGGLPTLVAMQKQTRTIPIVFAQVLDPVGAGFVDSLMHPGGNVTGFVSFEYSMAGKWLETLTQIARHRLPTIYPYGFFAREGGLASYGIVPSDNFRRAAGYIDRILKGEKSGELPVQVPTKFELVINLKTAKALGLALPEKLLATADELIE